MTSPKYAVAALFCGAIALVLPRPPAIGYVGDDPVPVHVTQCTFAQVSAALGPDGGVQYNVMGTCDGNPITGKMAYSPSQQKMQEGFFYRGAKVQTVAQCPNDPWTTGAPCQDQKVSAQGANVDPILTQPVPLSLRVVGAANVFQNARANAAKPNPPGPPVNFKAVILGMGPSTVVSWLGPEQQGPYGPYLDFVVEARPQNAAGAAWTRLGGTGRHAAANYQLTVKLPPPVAGTPGWELRACSTTVLASTCSASLIPTRDMAKELFQSPGNTFKGSVPVDPNKTLKSQSGTSASSIVAPKPTPAPNALKAPAPSFSKRPPIFPRGVEKEAGAKPNETTVPNP
jgi:hypothetical protein